MARSWIPLVRRSCAKTRRLLSASPEDRPRSWELAGLRLLTDPTFSPAGVHESAPGRSLIKTEDPALGIEEIGSVDACCSRAISAQTTSTRFGREVVAAEQVTLTTETAARQLGGTARALATWQQAALPLPDGGSPGSAGTPGRLGGRLMVLSHSILWRAGRERQHRWGWRWSQAA